MSNFDRERAEKSLVTVYQTDDDTGMGVLTCYDLILTAAHCLPRLPDPSALCDPIRVKFRPFATNDDAVALVVGADPYSDLAILSDGTVNSNSLDERACRDFNGCLAQLDPAELLLPDISHLGFA